MSDEIILEEEDINRRLEHWIDAPKAPSRLELIDFIQELNFNQIVETVNRLLGYIHSSKKIPELARALGRSKKEFEEGQKES